MGFRRPASWWHEGPQECGGGAAGFDGVWGGLEDGFEGRDREEAEGLVGLGLVVGDPSGDVGPGGPEVEVKKRVRRRDRVGRSEFGGEGLVVEVEGE